ncbi:MAG: hypothetical protein RL095_890 [Verrucomicrobiota bacterium]|jgi:type II secretory pathway pseudopilin PulG
MNARRHFTLIELFCVIVVILILVSMLHPALLKARQKTKMVLCGNNQHQIYLGAMRSAQNQRGNFPWASPNKGFGANGAIAAAEGNDAIWAASDGYMAQGLLYKEGYLSDGRLVYCPMAKKLSSGYHAGMEITYEGSGTGSWSLFGKSEWTGSSYAWNGSVGMIPGSRWGRNARVADSGETPLQVDSMYKPLHRDGFMVLRLDGSCNWNKTDPASILPYVPNFGWDQMFNYGWNGAFK